VTVNGGGTLFPYPRGKAPEQIFEALRVLIDRLNREQNTDSVDLDALRDAINAEKAEIAAILAQLALIETGGALTAQQAFELSLVTEVDTLLGTLSNMVLDGIKRSQEGAEATIRALVEGQKNKISIRVEQQARLTDREAFVSQLSTFEAQLLNALASITEEVTARADGDTALAAVDQTISTALNGNIAQVQVLTTSVDGIEQRYSVTLNQNGQVTGLVQLDGTAAGTNFTVVADKFQIAQPNLTGGAPVPVFSIQNVAGVTKLALRGDMIANGTITAAKIVASTLSAIVANLGTITAGKLQRADGTFIVDLDNKRLKISS